MGQRRTRRVRARRPAALLWATAAACCGAWPAGTLPPDPPEWTFTWWPKLEIARSDGAYRVRLGGRALFDGARIHYDGGLTRNPSGPGWHTEGAVRQGRIFVTARLFRDLELKAEVDFAPDDPTFADAYVGWRRLGPLGIARFGHQKVPFSFEQQMSRRYLLFMERSLAVSLDPSVRDVGFTLRNAVLDQRLRWVVGGFRDTDSTGRFFADPSNWTVAARLTGVPYWADEGRRMVHLGVSFSQQFRDADSLSISQSPESFLADELLGTGDVPGVERVARAGVDVVWVHGPFSLQGEWTQEFAHRSGAAGNLDFPGFYVQASWFPTGEHRSYLRSDGKFGAVIPRRSFDPANGGWGAVQLGARVSYVDLNDGDVRGGRQTDTTLGVNWFVFRNLRLTFNWVHGWVASEGDVDVVQGRVQIEY